MDGNLERAVVIDSGQCVLHGAMDRYDGDSKHQKQWIDKTMRPEVYEHLPLQQPATDERLALRLAY